MSESATPAPAKPGTEARACAWMLCNSLRDKAAKLAHLLNVRLTDLAGDGLKDATESGQRQLGEIDRDAKALADLTGDLFMAIVAADGLRGEETPDA